MMVSDEKRLAKLETSMSAMLDAMELAIKELTAIRIRLARHLVESEGAGLEPDKF